MAAAHHNAGLVHRQLRNWNAARTHLLRALKIDRTVDHRRGIVSDLRQLAFLSWENGDPRGGLGLFAEALEVDKLAGDATGAPLDTWSIASVHVELQEWDTALQLVRDAERLFGEVGASSQQALARQLVRQVTRVLHERATHDEGQEGE